MPKGCDVCGPELVRLFRAGVESGVCGRVPADSLANRFSMSSAPLNHSFIKYPSKTFHLPSIAWDAGDAAVNKKITIYALF